MSQPGGRNIVIGQTDVRVEIAISGDPISTITSRLCARTWLIRHSLEASDRLWQNVDKVLKIEKRNVGITKEDLDFVLSFLERLQHSRPDQTRNFDLRGKTVLESLSLWETAEALRLTAPFNHKGIDGIMKIKLQNDRTTLSLRTLKRQLNSHVFVPLTRTSMQRWQRQRATIATEAARSHGKRFLYPGVIVITWSCTVREYRWWERVTAVLVGDLDDQR
ncbi:hypothetical protein EJ08DRAFT_655096 [Tothia fuscella]|uniref:Uncharacterized protein n=1 Tax=Tothia fuscella TaxID=1048955 RepID=A0A9P4U4R6_9PEZI|nr:hypothetical protein EJ08DRAFT_655096 [Tothia fuscella]